jgi:hypothetical protein
MDPSFRQGFDSLELPPLECLLSNDLAADLPLDSLAGLLEGLDPTTDGFSLADFPAPPRDFTLEVEQQSTENSSQTHQASQSQSSGCGAEVLRTRPAAAASPAASQAEQKSSSGSEKHGEVHSDEGSGEAAPSSRARSPSECSKPSTSASRDPKGSSSPDEEERLNARRLRNRESERQYLFASQVPERLCACLESLASQAADFFSLACAGRRLPLAAAQEDAHGGDG